MLSDTVNKVGTGPTICHEISRIANTGVLANVMVKCVSFLQLLRWPSVLALVVISDYERYGGL